MPDCFHIAFGTVSIPVTNVKFPSAYGINLAAGDVDLYAVPSGKKALVIDVTFTNPADNPEGNVACDAAVKIGGNYHRFDYAAVTAMPGTYGSTSALAPFLLKSGETFAVHTSASGLSVWPYIIEFDEAAQIYDARLMALRSGENTLFTLHENASISFVGMPAANPGPMRGRIWYYNLSGASRNVQINAVPRAAVPAPGNAIFNATVSERQMAQPLLYGGLSAGDFINITTDNGAASQIAWAVYTTQ